MNAIRSTHRKGGKILTNILSLLAILAIALPVTQVAYAASASPFVGKWQATDIDGSDIRLSIGGPPSGPFQITWTESYISFCNGEAGIVRGTAQLNESDPNLLAAELHVECLTTGASLDFPFAWRYHPLTGTLSSRYENGDVTIWRRPGRPQPTPPALGLRVNYGHDWVESFYEAGHMAWITVTESDGVTVKATAELVTEPKDFWNGDTGFTTNPESWVPGSPDIQPNDWVFGWVDNGASAQVQIGDISGMIDLMGDSIEGTITAPWFSNEVEVDCHSWGAPLPEEILKQDWVQPNGEDTYSCSWAGEWDIQPYQDVGVGYFGLDGHWVANAFFARNPRIVASEAGDWFWTTDFNPGTLNLFIYASAEEGATLLWSGQQEADESGFVVVGSDVHGQDLVPGNYLVVSDGVSEKGLVLESISVDVFDTENEIMAGTAPQGREVWAMAGPQHWQQPIMVYADPVSGAWFADFKTIEIDITEDMRPWSFAHIYDEDGDANEGNTPPLFTTIFVTSTDDIVANDGICTLREAIIAASINSPSGDMNGECPAGTDSQPDTIVLTANNIYSLTIDRSNDDTEADGDLDVWDNSSEVDLVIRVAGDGKATISQDALSVDDRVLENDATIQLENLIITGGGNVGSGGGLANNGTMEIVASEVSGNSVGWDGGGIYNSSSGTLSIDSSTIDGNTSSAFAGGIMNKGTLTLNNSKVTANTDLYGGGGINNEGTLTIDNSGLSANSSGQGGALYNSGTAVIMNSLVGGSEVEQGNIASDGGGGLFSLGTLTVENTIVSGNWAPYGGGLFNWIGGMLTISNSTVSDNSANQGGGLHNKENSTAIIRDGSIFSSNYAEWSGAGVDNWGTITIDESVLRENMSPGVGDAISSGVFAESTASITASCIVDNGDTAVFNSLLTPLNATGNWWGDASGPSGIGPGSGDSVGDFVDYSSWLTEPPSICTSN